MAAAATEITRFGSGSVMSGCRQMDAGTLK
jgi:hypothetical protein